MTAILFTDITPQISPSLFFLLLAAMVGTSPVLILAFGYMAYRWVTSPFRKDEEEPFGDWPHIEGRQ